MPNNPERSIILRPDSQVEKSPAQTKRIVAAMIDETLSVARQLGTLEAKRFKIGAYEWCEPDYRQILAWVQMLSLAPEMVIQRLLDD